MLAWRDGLSRKYLEGQHREAENRSSERLPPRTGALGYDKKPVSGLVAAAALNFSADPISRASRPASIAFLNAFAMRMESEAIAMAVLT